MSLPQNRRVDPKSYQFKLVIKSMHGLKPDFLSLNLSYLYNLQLCDKQVI